MGTREDVRERRFSHVGKAVLRQNTKWATGTRVGGIEEETDNMPGEDAIFTLRNPFSDRF